MIHSLPGKEEFAAICPIMFHTSIFTEDKQLSNWDVPKFTVGYLRLQLAKLAVQ